MTRTLNVASVRKSVRVNAAPARAFEVFTTGVTRWWLKSHTTSVVPMKEIVIEPRAGGRWFDPGLVTEVEVRFIPEAANVTRVELEHRNLERFGDESAILRGKIDAPGGWTVLLDNYAACCRAMT